MITTLDINTASLSDYSHMTDGEASVEIIAEANSLLVTRVTKPDGGSFVAVQGNGDDVLIIRQEMKTAA